LASESSPPPPPSGGGAKYAILGVVLLLLSAGVYWLTAAPEDPPPTVSSELPDAAVIQRSTALADETLEIPEAEPDAWSEIPDAGPETRTPRGPRGPVLGSWDCPGEVERAAASAEIAEHRQQITACYERRLKQEAMLQGTVNLQVRIGQGGSVEAVQVAGSLRDREVFSCIRNVANQMRFPRVSGGNCAVLSVPFSFTPQR
jgi:hypothetical protein